MVRYEVTVAGVFGPATTLALEGFDAVELPGGRTRLVGEPCDQAAFHAFLDRLHDLRLEILEVHRLDPTDVDAGS